MTHGVDSVIVTAAQRNAPTLAQMAVLAQQAVDALDDTSSVDQFRMAIESAVLGAEVTVTRVGEQVIATLIKNDNSISLVCNRASSEGSEEERIQLAGMVDHQSGASDAAADDLRHDIINSPNPSTYTGYNNVAYSGTTYYVSASGNDNNNGTSPDTPWKSISKINSANLSAGSKVLFRRGDTFRGYIVTKSNVYYGAYGEGVKPNIYGSYKNYADSTSTWTEDTTGIWKTKVYDATGSASNKESLDVGVIVGNHGEFAGKKKLTAELNANGDFFYDKSSGYVYIKMPVNPANHFTSIEIGVHRWLVAIPANSTGVTVENLNLKYTGGYGVVVSGGYDGSVVSDTVIKNCEFGFIGGSYDYNANVRKGNGVEFWAGCNGGVVENCWFYQIYDSAITHQASISDKKVFTAQNLTFCGNVIEYCGMYGIEYWVSDGADSVGNVNRMLNIVYDANIIRFSGYGHGGRAGTGVGIGSPLSNSKNLMDNFVVSNNIVDTARYYLIHMVTTQWKANLNLPTMINTTLIQREGDSYSWGAYWTNQGSITYYPATEQGTLDAAARLNGTGSGNILILQ